MISKIIWWKSFNPIFWDS